MPQQLSKYLLLRSEVVAIATNGVYILHWTMHLAAAVGGDRVGGGAVVWVRGRGVVGVKGGIPTVLGRLLEAMVCACLDLLVTGSGRSLGRE